MTTTEANTYRRQLLALLSRLDQARAELKEEALRPEDAEASGGLSNVQLHTADLGSQACEEDVSLRLMENKVRMIAEVNAALARLDRGVFGQCEGCRRKIAKSRLQVLPYARYCVACARKREEQPLA